MSRNATYTEQRQAALFKAGRELLRIAANMLDEVTNRTELLGATAPWARSWANGCALQGETIIEEAAKLTYVGSRARRANGDAIVKYYNALGLFTKRVEAAQADQEPPAAVRPEWLYDQA